MISANYRNTEIYTYNPYFAVGTVGLTNGTIGTTKGNIGTNVSTNGNSSTNGTIDCRETFNVLWLSMVPLVKFPMVPVGESRTHAVTD